LKLLGPLVVAAAVWCAAGHITVATPDSATPRIAVGAPWWVFLLAALMAWPVRAWRERLATATPALLSVLPWLPIPLPVIALIWTGPLAWLPVGLAIFAAFAPRDTAVEYRSAAAATASVPRGPLIVAFLLTIAAGALTTMSVGVVLPSGDEPHYLVITQSLLKDGDLRIQNNHDRRDYEEYYPGDLPPHTQRIGRNNQIYSVHSPGTSVAVLPGFAFLGYPGALATILIAAALASALIWRIGWMVTGQRGAAWFAWAAVVFSATLLLQSVMVFPDALGALATAAGLWLLVRIGKGTNGLPARAIVAGSAALAALPWLHTRFAPIALGLGLAIAARFATQTKDRWRPVAIFAIVPVVSAVGWFTYFVALYGTPNPAAAYGDLTRADGTHAAYVPGGLLGLVFDQQFGLLAYSPVLAGAIFGLGRLVHRDALWIGRVSVAIAAVSLAGAAAYWMWWAGVPATPARLATAVLPLLTVPLAVGWQTASALGRQLLLMLLIISLAIAVVVIGVEHGALAWNVHDARALWLGWLGPVVNLCRAWPSAFLRLVGGPVVSDNVASEVPFMVSVLVTTMTVAGSWLVLVAVARVRGWASSVSRLAVIWWLVGAVSLASELNWWMSSARPLAAAPSQMAILDGVSQGRLAILLESFSLSAISRANLPLVIRADERGAIENPPWLEVSDLPPGVYQLRVHLDRPESGQFEVDVSFSPKSWRVLTLVPTGDQSFVLSLPAGAAALSVAPDAGLRHAHATVDLSPFELHGLYGGTERLRAQAAMRYGATDVFFLDAGAFIEDDGFWVRGRDTADLLLVPAGATSVTLAIRNGQAPNVVTVETVAMRKTYTMAPGDTRDVPVPMPDGSRVLRVKIMSQAGFRSAETGSRLLGARVEIR
jgi:hypothetical protein